MGLKLIYVIIGHYGSGKTEVAVSLARSIKNATIIDMDIVNPYFRSKDAQSILEKEGIKLIAPEFANTNVDIPSLPPEILGALQSDENVILDVGGDEDGAIALGQYSRIITEKGYEMICVVNTRRPMTENAEGVVETVRLIEQASRLKVTSLINNTNVKNETTPQMIEDGQAIIEKASKMLEIPVKAIACVPEIANSISINLPKIILDLFIKLPWEV